MSADAPMSEYRVNLDLYNGPLDLLLYLIRRDEVDIYDIPIASVTEQYIQYVEMLKTLDPNLAGDFLVLAATLIEIKTRMLLPTPPPEEGDAEGVEIDPRAELVRQLLEYKAFKDAAGELADAAAQQSLKFARRPGRTEDSDEDQLDLEDAQVWDLLDAFTELMAQIGQQDRQHEVIYDDTPLELHEADILDRLANEGSLTFRRIFEGRTNRSEIVGLFLALLELVRQKKVFANQERSFGEVHIRANPNPPVEDKLDLSQPEPPADEDRSNQKPPDAEATQQPPPEPDNASDEARPDDATDGASPENDSRAGHYVAEADTEPDDDTGTATAGSGA